MTTTPIPETLECKIVGADADARTITVEVPAGVRGAMIGDSATIAFTHHAIQPPNPSHTSSPSGAATSR